MYALTYYLMEDFTCALNIPDNYVLVVTGKKKRGLTRLVKEPPSSKCPVFKEKQKVDITLTLSLIQEENKYLKVKQFILYLLELH